jgi:hypothetical protein
MEIPEDLQVKFGYDPLGEADGPVKRGLLGLNAARHFAIDVESTGKAVAADKLASLKREYEAQGPERSNLAYGFIAERV